MQQERAPNDQSGLSNLPALLPPATLLLQRTQTTLGLLRDVVQESSANYWYEKGKKDKASGNWEEAMFDFRTCMMYDSGHGRAALHLSTALAYQHKYEASTALLLEAYELPYLDWKSFVTELSTPDWQLLRVSLEACKSNNQVGFNTLLAIALVHRALKEKRLARQAMEVMRFLYPSQVDQSSTWHMLSGALCGDEPSDKDCRETAKLFFDRAIELSPETAAFYHNMGNAKWESWIYWEAITCYRRAIELNNNLLYAYYNSGRAGCHWGTHRPNTDAIPHLDRAIELEPKFASAFLYRGKAKSQSGDKPGALNDYNQAIELDSTDAYAYLVRGRHKDWFLEDYAAALADFDQAVKLDTTSARGFKDRGRMRHELGDYLGAIADYDRVTELEPNHATVSIREYKERAILRVPLKS